MANRIGCSETLGSSARWAEGRLVKEIALNGAFCHEAQTSFSGTATSRPLVLLPKRKAGPIPGARGSEKNTSGVAAKYSGVIKTPNAPCQELFSFVIQVRSSYGKCVPYGRCCPVPIYCVRSLLLKELFDVKDALRFYRLFQPGFVKILPLNQKCSRRVNRAETTRGQGLCGKRRPPA